MTDAKVCWRRTRARFGAARRWPKPVPSARTAASTRSAPYRCARSRACAARSSLTPKSALSVTVRGEGYMLMPDAERMSLCPETQSSRHACASSVCCRRSLYGRTLLIIVVPTLITLAAATFVFFDRHWYTVTNRLTYAVAGDVAVVVDLMQKSPNPESKAAVVRLAAEKMDLSSIFVPDAKLPDTPKKMFIPSARCCARPGRPIPILSTSTCVMRRRRGHFCPRAGWSLYRSLASAAFIRRPRRCSSPGWSISSISLSSVALAVHAQPDPAHSPPGRCRRGHRQGARRSGLQA